MQKLYVIGLLVLFVSGCSSTKSVQTEVQHAASVGEIRCFNLLQLSDQDQILARELLWEALDEVGLYTILDTLKAVSDVRSFRVSAVDDFIHADSLSKVNERFDFDQMQRVVNALQCGNTRFIITPFAAIHEEQRYFQIRVVNTSVLDEVLQTYAAFWQNWGFVPGSDAETIVTVIEYESRFNRFRGYGYLYGYPAHAVDFFVEAARVQQDTGDFVTRDFVQIPAFVRETGMFVYAVPKGHELNAIDLQLREAAVQTLERYKVYRTSNTFTHPEELIRYWLSEDGN
ncbi:MAG: hypothetical protein JJU41_11355 [Bacteroidetes bacterium]|nr:hypothetical protein [Bacteroidota bacterium]MCH8524857.1 hypothetical protein [Balneolales bacterium]